MRVFIAIELPEEIKEKLRRIKIKEEIAKIVYPSDYHLTLKFLGEIDKKKLEIVKRNLSRIRFKGVKLKLEKIGYFPNPNYINVVWVGVTPKRKIIELKEKIDDALMELFPREKRFEPHITLGRVKFVKDKIRFKQDFEREFEESFDADCFKLIKSELTEKGSKYEVLEEYR